MEKLSLVALLDEDRERVLANLNGDRALSSAQATLEKAIDRVMYRYVEGCGDETLRNSAQHILQTMKNTLPVIDAVGEVRTWKKQAEGSRRDSLNLGPMAIAAMIGGAVLILAAVVGVLIAGRMSGALAFLKALLPATLGGGCLYWAGILSARPKKASNPDDISMRTEYLVDAEKAFHCLRGAMVQADGQLDKIQEESALQRHRAVETMPGGTKIAPEVLELCVELLEAAYASSDESARESISSIRFFLHNGGVDVVDLGEGKDSWFEFLPAGRSGTIRPALASGGKLIKKGLASTKH